MGKFYAVKNGYHIGIYTSWEDCEKEVLGFSGSKYKSFTRLEDAKAYLAETAPNPHSQAVSEPSATGSDAGFEALAAGSQVSFIPPSDTQNTSSDAVCGVSDAPKASNEAVCGVSGVPKASNNAVCGVSGASKASPDAGAELSEAGSQVSFIPPSDTQKASSEAVSEPSAAGSEAGSEALAAGSQVSFIPSSDAQKASNNAVCGVSDVQKASAGAGAVAYVDGSYNAETGVYGCGVVIFLNGAESSFSRCFSDPEMALMHNVAGEIEGAMLAMRFCLDRGIEKLDIYYDYEGIEKWCSGAWKTTKQGTAAYKRFYDSIKRRLKINFIKVKGHSGDKYNDMADRLAKDAVGID